MTLFKSARVICSALLLCLFLTSCGRSVFQDKPINFAGVLPEQSSQYGFMVGDWDIKTTGFDSQGNVTGQGTGIWWADYVHDGRAIFENAVMINGDGSLEANMPAVRTYSADREHWVSRHMFPLGGSDNYACDNVSRWHGNKMHLDSVCISMEGEIKSYSRIRFFNIDELHFDYTWESSKDGKQWTKRALINATRRAPGNERPPERPENYKQQIPKESSQYDFLLGEWKIKGEILSSDMKRIYQRNGYWDVSSLHGGMALYDDRVYINESGELEPREQTLRTYSQRIQKWSSLPITSLKDPGLCVDNQIWNDTEMWGTRKCVSRTGEVEEYGRIRFYNISNDGFTYSDERSADNKNWYLVEKVTAVRQ